METFLTDRCEQNPIERTLLVILVDARFSEKIAASGGTFLVHPALVRESATRHESQHPFVIFLTAIRNTSSRALTAL
jgi:hypothetical protein